MFLVEVLMSDRVNYDSQERTGLGAEFRNHDPEIDKMLATLHVSLEHFYDHANVCYNMSLYFNLYVYYTITLISACADVRCSTDSS